MMIRNPGRAPRSEETVGLEQFLSDIRNDPKRLHNAVVEFLSRDATSGKSPRVVARVASGESTREVVARLIKDVETATAFVDGNEKGVLITSPKAQEFFETRSGKTWRDWVTLESMGAEGGEIQASVEEKMKDASWRETASDMKTEVLKLELELKDDVYLVRETFTTTGLAGGEQPLSGKFYLVKTN
jgi:hypothetical protein